MIDPRKLQHSKKIGKKIESGQRPTASEIRDGEFALRYITGSGLYLVAKYQNTLYYLKFSKDFS